MSELKGRIDCVLFVLVRGANPNGNPLADNYPRVDRAGRGEITSVCLTHKARNRYQDMGYDVLVKSNDRCDDGYNSIEGRLRGTIKLDGKKDKNSFASKVCERFIDARGHGSVIAVPGDKKGDGLSIGIRGPITMGMAKSVHPIIVESVQITKSTNGMEKDVGRGSDTMGMQHFVEFGLYRVQCSINVRAARQTGFSYEDAQVFKEALKTLFVNDESAARPAGSMEVVRMFWFEHDSAIGNYSHNKVFGSVHADLVGDEDVIPSSLDDYRIYVDELPGLSVEDCVL